MRFDEPVPRSTRPRPSRRQRRATALAALAAGAVLLTGCAEAVDGSGTRGLAPVPTGSAPASAPGSGSASTPGLATGSASASASASTSGSAPTAFPSGTGAAPSPSTTGIVGQSCSGSDYCDGFADSGSGWDVATQSDYRAGYSAVGGGSYSVQSRYDGTIYEPAPVDVTTFASNYAVRVDVDAGIGTAGTHPEVGLRCWGHDAPQNRTAGFSGYLDQDHVSITLRDEKGVVVPLKTASIADGLPTDGTQVHLALACLVARSASGAKVADIALAINGTLRLEVMYAKGSGHASWNTGKEVGVLLGDQNAIGNFDNFAVNHLKN